MDGYGWYEYMKFGSLDWESAESIKWLSIAKVQVLFKGLMGWYYGLGLGL